MLELSSPSQTAPLRSSLVGANRLFSHKKKRKSNAITGPSSLDEENALNTSSKLWSHSSKAAKKKNVTMMEDCTIPTIDTNLKPSFVPFNPSPNVSECGTDLSVSDRREWLKNFEKKQSSNIFRALEKDKPRDEESQATNMEKERRDPPAFTTTTIHASSKSTIVTNTPASLHDCLGLNSTRQPSSAKKPRKPRQFINRRASSGPSWMAPKKEEVKATDDGHASVASLSKWLENDPTSAKKKRHVRRGRNILSRSRQFEKDDENMIIMEAKISRGAVGNKKEWLQKAFKTEEDEDEVGSTFSGYVQSDVGRSARPFPRYNSQHGAQTEIITDDAASSLSVADKKDWLKKAFVKNSEERKNLRYNKAQTDVMHRRDQSDDQAVSRAKLRFKERSARKLMGATSSRPSEQASSKSNEPILEDKTPVDFRSAREALVQRSQKNGHNTKVVNKAHLRKKRIERQEEDFRRKSLSTGLVLKTSWDLSDDSNGGAASNTYEKKFVPVSDIAPKKSFEELP